jgi:hypothetical protein
MNRRDTEPYVGGVGGRWGSTPHLLPDVGLGLPTAQAFGLLCLGGWPSNRLGSVVAFSQSLLGHVPDVYSTPRGVGSFIN